MAAAKNAGAATYSVFDKVNHALDMLGTNHRANIGAGFFAGTEAQLFRFCYTACGKLIADGLLDEEAFHGKADLAAICVAAPDGGAGGNVEIRIRQDEHSVLATKFQHGWDEAFGAGFRDAAAR